MKLNFVDSNAPFIKCMIALGYDAVCMDIKKVPCNSKTYFVSPANSLGYMDGGIDWQYAYCMFPGLEEQVMAAIQTHGMPIKGGSGRKYLPIGNALIVNHLIVAPTMLTPQSVKHTLNALHAFRAVLTIAQSLPVDSVIVCPGFCTGYGEMSPETAARQIHEAIALGPFTESPGDKYTLEQPDYSVNLVFKHQ